MLDRRRQRELVRLGSDQWSAGANRRKIHTGRMKWLIGNQFQAASQFQAADQPIFAELDERVSFVRDRKDSARPRCKTTLLYTTREIIVPATLSSQHNLASIGATSVKRCAMLLIDPEYSCETRDCDRNRTDATSEPNSSTLDKSSCWWNGDFLIWRLSLSLSLFLLSLILWNLSCEVREMFADLQNENDIRECTSDFMGLSRGLELV